jgi:carboxymethylenebutenolidase
MSISRWEEIALGTTSARMYATGTEGAPRVAVFHPWWGLNDDVLAYADRLAGHDLFVVAPDLVQSRLATTPEDAEAIATGVDEKHADAVALAAIDRLAPPGSAARVVTVGFSFGAAWAMWSAAERPAVVGSVVYYGSIQGPSLGRAHVPVLGHFAESDPYEPDESVAAFERALREAGREAVIHRYPGTGHWFAEPSRDAFRREAAQRAFDRTVAFVRQRLS